MRVSAVLGFIVALLIGTVALGSIVVTLANQPPIVATMAPVTTPEAMVTLPPTPTPVQTPIVSSPSPSPSASGSTVPTGTAIGQQIPAFDLPNLEGSNLGTAASAGKPLWVNFMASWCPSCQDELPMMETMKFQLGDSMDMILVDVGEDQTTVTNFMNLLQVDLPVALDADGAVQKQWKAFALPVHFFIDGNGVVQQVVYGGAPRSIFVDAVHTLLPKANFSFAP